jgi:hypothetical protein
MVYAGIKYSLRFAVCLRKTPDIRGFVFTARAGVHRVPTPDGSLLLSYSSTQKHPLLTAFLSYTLALSDYLIAHLLNA